MNFLFLLMQNWHPSPCSSKVLGVVLDFRVVPYWMCRQTAQTKANWWRWWSCSASRIYFSLRLHFFPTQLHLWWVHGGFFLILLHLIMAVSRVCSGIRGQAGEPTCVVAMTTYGEAVNLSVASPCWHCVILHWNPPKGYTTRLFFSLPSISCHRLSCIVCFFALPQVPLLLFSTQAMLLSFIFPIFGHSFQYVVVLKFCYKGLVLFCFSPALSCPICSYKLSVCPLALSKFHRNVEKTFFSIPCI